MGLLSRRPPLPPPPPLREVSSWQTDGIQESIMIHQTLQMRGISDLMVGNLQFRLKVLISDRILIINVVDSDPPLLAGPSQDMLQLELQSRLFDVLGSLHHLSGGFVGWRSVSIRGHARTLFFGIEVVEVRPHLHSAINLRQVELISLEGSHKVVRFAHIELCVMTDDVSS